MRFCFVGYVNSQNMSCWSAENQHVFCETPLHSVKIGIWCAMSRRCIIGPKLFEKTVTVQRYGNNILTAFVQKLQDDELQDGFFHMTVPRHIFIFKTPIHTIEELKDRITEECGRISPATLQNLVDNMKRRVNLLYAGESLSSSTVSLTLFSPFK